MGSDSDSKPGRRARWSHKIRSLFGCKVTISSVERLSQASSREPLQAPSREPSQAPSRGPLEAPSREPLQAPCRERSQVPSSEPFQNLSQVRFSNAALAQTSDEIVRSDIRQDHNVDLWANAYIILGNRNPNLVENYEKYLKENCDFTVSGFSSSSPELIKAIIKSKFKDREDERWVVSIGKAQVHVREQSEKVAKFILWSNKIISPVLSSHPYTALAWSGISILFNVSYARISSLTNKY